METTLIFWLFVLAAVVGVLSYWFLSWLFNRGNTDEQTEEEKQEDMEAELETITSDVDHQTPLAPNQ